jgi:hypothetical protein
MNKILLTFTILGAGAAGFLTACQSTTQLQQEANATRATWLAQTELVASAESDRTGLIQNLHELKEPLTQPQAVAENPLWSVLQTNRAGQLTPELRERLLEELGFNWQSSEGFIVVSKEALREIQINAIREGKLTENAATVLAMTQGERGQVEAAMQQVHTDYKDWALSHIERSEPKDDVVAQYSLPADTTMSISNNFATGVIAALGRERAELILLSARNWMSGIIGFPEKPTTMIIKRYLAGNEQRLKFQIQDAYGKNGAGEDLSRRPRFPTDFLPIFPNGWADVAKREGFEMPKESQEK